MAISVEDGTGKADAVSYQDAASVSAYLGARRVGTTFDGLSEAQQEAACVIATDYLQNAKRFRWRGTPLVSTQALAWPRTGAVDPDGVAIPAMPPRLLAAHAELCYLLTKSGSTGITPEALQPSKRRGGRVVQQAVAGISQTFASDAPTETELTSVVGLLEPLLRTPLDPPPPTFTSATDDLTAFEPS
jgi:hypothetical protein